MTHRVKVEDPASSLFDPTGRLIMSLNKFFLCRSASGVQRLFFNDNIHGLQRGNPDGPFVILACPPPARL
jgi:hypothetical protein